MGACASAPRSETPATNNVVNEALIKQLAKATHCACAA